MIRDLLPEVQPREPTVSQMHPYFFQQTPLARDPIQITHQQQTQQHFGIDRRTAGSAVVAFEAFPYEAQIDVAINLPQQVVFGDLLF